MASDMIERERAPEKRRSNAEVSLGTMLMNDRAPTEAEFRGDDGSRTSRVTRCDWIATKIGPPCPSPGAEQRRSWAISQIPD